LASDQGTRALLIGGAPFAEQVLLWWNVEDDTSRPRIGH
jgi:redox-sensitive bicupin YhaK (pirin superfamily)